MASGGRWVVPAPAEACLSRSESPCEGVTPTCTLPGGQDQSNATWRGLRAHFHHSSRTVSVPSGAAQPPSPCHLIQCPRHVWQDTGRRPAPPRTPCCSAWPTKRLAQATLRPPFHGHSTQCYSCTSPCHNPGSCFCLPLPPQCVQPGRSSAKVLLH